jgi:hypothetical protein
MADEVVDGPKEAAVGHGACRAQFFREDPVATGRVFGAGNPLLARAVKDVGDASFESLEVAFERLLNRDHCDKYAVPCPLVNSVLSVNFLFTGPYCRSPCARDGACFSTRYRELVTLTVEVSKRIRPQVRAVQRPVVVGLSPPSCGGPGGAQGAGNDP